MGEEVRGEQVSCSREESETVMMKGGGEKGGECRNGGESEEVRRLRAENAELALRVMELQEAAVVDEAEMESAVAEMEAVMEDMAEKLGAAEAQLERERKEFGMKLQMLAMESADQELARRKLVDGKKEEEMEEDEKFQEAGRRRAASSSDAATAGGGGGGGGGDTANLRRRIAELESELEMMRLSRASSAEAAQLSDIDANALKTNNPFGASSGDAHADAGADATADGGALNRSLTPRTAQLRTILGRTMTELKARRAERARAAAERAAERLVQSASAGGDGDVHFGNLTASAALAALSPDKKLLNPDDDAVVEMLARAEQKRRKSSNELPMRSWDHQPAEVIRAELIRRGIGDHQGVNDKDVLLKLLRHAM